MSAPNSTKLFNTTRLAFSEKFREEIYSFSDKYCREHFKVFREKWNEWQKEHEKELAEEIGAIQHSGIKDTVEEIKEKIYTSARFYARKRTQQQEKKQKQKQKQNKPKHTKLPPVSSSIKKTIEEFVKNKLKTIKNKPEKPIELYTEYCKTYIVDIKNEINRLRQITSTIHLDPQEISLKFKKAFHNYLYRKYSIMNSE
jgi:hypothetical protein